jgi:hypothetical protein
MPTLHVVRAFVVYKTVYCVYDYSAGKRKIMLVKMNVMYTLHIDLLCYVKILSIKFK